ncbi:MAG: hypothetical protein ACRD3T_19085, partial [Terriglobia bacterium]
LQHRSGKPATNSIRSEMDILNRCEWEATGNFFAPIGRPRDSRRSRFDSAAWRLSQRRTGPITKAAHDLDLGSMRTQ